MFKKTKICSSIACILAIGAFNTAFAAEEIDATKEEASEAEVERIEVTGSRLTRTTFDAPSPTTVISAETIKMTGELNLNEVLTSMPQFGKGFDSTSGNYSFGNSGINAPDLRDLGATRTLTLINGKRPVPIASDSNMLYTDIGIIPSELVERIEVVSGGGSAVYGSDAVAGVVNFILKKDFEGTTIRAQVGDSEAGGGATQSATLVHGMNFDEGRGNFSVSLDYFNQEELLFADRPGSANTSRYINNPDNTGPDDGIYDKIIARGLTYPWFGGDQQMFGMWAGGPTDWYQLSDGNATLRTPGSNTIEGGWLANDGSGVSPLVDAQSRNPYDRINAYARFGYEFDSFSMAADVMYSKTSSEDQIDPAFVWESYHSLDSLIASGYDVPGAVTDLMDGYKNYWVSLPQVFRDENGRGRGHSNDRNYFAASVTFEGDINDNWSWDAYLTSGFTATELEQTNGLRKDRFDKANLRLIGPCVEAGTCPDYNPFEPISGAVADYILADHITYTDVVAHGFAANVNGELLELPAGMVQVTTGVDVRYESIDYKPSFLWSNNLLSSFKTSMDASRTIKEVYGEVLIPVLSDVFLVKDLEFEAALRYADYSTESASFTSSKLAANWAVTDDVRFRASYSEAVRAPQLAEMLGGMSIGFQDVTDPCDADEIDGGPADGRRKANCQALGIQEGWDSNVKGKRGKVVSSGNPDLEEEKAQTLTVGVVFQPTFIDDFRLSVDYYDIQLEDMIGRFGPNSVMSNCVDLESINNEFCQQVNRADNGDIIAVNDTFLNSDESRRRGIDIEMDYLFDFERRFDWAGELHFNLAATHQLEKSFTSYDYVEGTPLKTDSLGKIGSPEWRGNFRATYSVSDFVVRWTTEYSQGGPVELDLNPERYESADVDDSIVHKLWLGYDVMEDLNVYAGVNNVMDEKWVDHPYTNWGTRIGYSLLGRSYYAGVTYSF